MVPKLLGFAFLAIISSAHCEESNRDARFSIFQIIKFANEPCEGGTRNGTCFTAQECEDQGGTDSGSCADGFGVCCSIVLTEGGSSSLNQSYMVQDASTTVDEGTMMYTICPCSTDVCRIRFDFTQFMLAGPYVNTDGTTSGAGTGAGAEEAFAAGDCLTDTFSITGPNSGTPIICGTNDGQHMIVDTDGSSCLTVNFGIGGTTGTSRNWDIMTTQYRCGEEAGGPPGCLQWHMEGTGSVRSFNFPRQARGAAVADTTTHLSSQRYSICIRRPAGTTNICYIPCTYDDGSATNMQESFGLSIGPDAAAAKSAVSVSECQQDYIEIIGGTTAIIAAMGIVSDNNMWCGRTFQTATNLAYDAAGNSVCTASAPFRIRVNFDEDEWRTNAVPATASNADAAANDGEFAVRPGGIIGFSLCYTTQ